MWPNVCWVSFLCLTLCHFLPTSGFPGHNTPPVFDFNREWVIPANEPIGNRIITVRTRDGERDRITYGIEPALFLDGSKYFTINPRTGEVLLRESLDGQAGKEFYLLVSANDGHQTAKIETYVRITDPNDDGSVPPEADNNRTSARRPQPFPSFGSQRPKVPSIPFELSNGPVPSPWPGIPANPSPSGSRKRIPTARPLPTLKPVTAAPTATRDINEIPVDITTQRPERSNHSRLDWVTAFLPLFAAIIFAPVMGLVFFVLHRWYTRRKRKNLMKSISQKMPLEIETSISSFSSGDTDHRIDFFKSYPVVKRNTLANRYESSEFISAPFAPKINGSDPWEFPRKNLRFTNILLGEGNFGQVWKCEALDLTGEQKSEVVAVKMLKQNHTEKEKRDLMSELQIMKLLDPHPNIVSLLGCCSDKDPVYLIMEFVPHGKLLTYLRDSRSRASFGCLTSQDLTSFAYQVAKGMEYISSKNILHRDLAARNVLIGHDKVCKISDFGFARDVIASHVYETKSEGKMPIRWMAPESLIQNIYTTKSDVWSFGVLLWEIVTLGSTPYPTIPPKEIIPYLQSGDRLQKPDHCKRELFNIMYYCWDWNPDNRPSFSDLKKYLDDLLISENDYIELERCPDHAYYNIIKSTSSIEEKL